jgi:hypothetical protein
MNASQVSPTEEKTMRNADQTGPTLRVRREALRQLAVEDLRRVAGGSQRCMDKAV